MNTWKVILATLVIFGAGIVAGRLITGRTLDAQSPGSGPALHQPAPGSEKQRLPAPLPGILRKDFVDRLDSELKLSAEQRERIEKVIGHGQEQARALWRGVEPEMHKALVATKDKIRAELTPEQQAQFNQLLKQKSKSPQRAPGDEKSTNAAAPASIEFAFDWSFCSFLDIKPDCHGTNGSPAGCL